MTDIVFNTGETQSELRAKYNPEGSILRRAQMRMLDMLLYFDKVCKEQKISYRIDGGNVLGASVPKQFVEVLGKPVIAYTMEHFQNHSEIDAIELVCVDGYQDYLKGIAERYGITKEDLDLFLGYLLAQKYKKEHKESV